MKLYTSGEMANLTCISKRALSLYEKKGLIEPRKISEASGYHYFSADQFEIIDIIRLLADLGFSLDQISEFMSTSDVEDYRQGLDGMFHQVSEDIVNLERKKFLLDMMLDRSYAYDSATVTTDVVGTEFSSFEYRILTFPVKPAIDLGGISADTAAEQWSLYLRKLKRRFIELDIPLDYFQCVGSIISLSDLAAKRHRITQAYIIVDDQYSHPEIETRTVQRGLYISTYKAYRGSASGEAPECEGLKSLLKYAEEHNYIASGDLLCERVTDESIFRDNCNHHLLKLNLPVQTWGSQHVSQTTP